MRSMLISSVMWFVLVAVVSAQAPVAPMPGSGGVMTERPDPSRSVTVVTVPEDYNTISQAIGDAKDGWVIKVRRGTYKEMIDFMGKAVTVESIGGPEHTVVDGRQLGYVARFKNGEGRDSVLDGFTLTNGLAWSGGVYISNSSPTIRNRRLC